MTTEDLDMRTPRSHSIAKRPGSAASAALATVLAFGSLSLASPRVALADDQTVSPNGKGIIGGAFLGAEVVTITESLAGAHKGWAFLVGGGLGAVAGGVGGYLIEHNDSSDGKVPAYMLAAGVGLIIPALVLSLNATRYMPAETVTEDKAPTNNAPPANPGVPGGSSATGTPATGTPATGATTTPPATTSPPATTAPATTPAPASAPAPGTSAPTTTPSPAGGGAAPPLSLFDVRRGTMRLGIPVPEVRPVFTAADVRQLGVQQQTEVRMPIVKVTF